MKREEYSCNQSVVWLDKSITISRLSIGAGVVIGATTKFIIESAGGAREEKRVCGTYLGRVVCMRGKEEERMQAGKVLYRTLRLRTTLVSFEEDRVAPRATSDDVRMRLPALKGARTTSPCDCAAFCCLTHDDTTHLQSHKNLDTSKYVGQGYRR
jgi:hypothetical protein